MSSQAGFPQQAAAPVHPQQAAPPVYPQQAAVPMYPQAAAPVYPQQAAAPVFPQQATAPVFPQEPAQVLPQPLLPQHPAQALSQPAPQQAAPQAWQPSAYPTSTSAALPQAPIVQPTAPAPSAHYPTAAQPTAPTRPVAQPTAPSALAAQHPTAAQHSIAAQHPTAAQHSIAAQPARPGFDDLFGGIGAAPHETIEAPVRRRVAETTPNSEAEQADRRTGRGSASSMSGGSGSAEATSARGRAAERRPAAAEPGGFDALFADLGDADEADEAPRGGRGRSARKAEKPKKPSRAEKAAAKRGASAKNGGPRRGSSVPSAPRPIGGDVDLAALIGGTAATGASVAGALGATPAAAAAGSAAPAAAVSAPSLFGAAATPSSSPPTGDATTDRGGAASAVVPPIDATGGFATAIAAAAGARPGFDAAAPAPAPLNLDRPIHHGNTAPVDADVTGVSDLLDFGRSSDTTPTAPAPSRRAAQRPEPARESARPATQARRSAPRVAPRPAPRPAASAPRRRRVTRQLASLVAMSFAALLAVATTIPSLSLLTPEDVQALALSDTSGFGRDGQRVTINGDVVAQSVQREGYEHMSMAEYAAAAGIRAEADFINNPAGTIQWPFAVGVHVGDRFGYRDCAGCSSDHGGQDFNPGLGAEIQAIADGTVAVSTDSGGSLGVVMMIDHIIDGELVTSVYAHMEYGSRRFEVGDTVHVADVIGTTGSTGMSTGPHLHFEIRLGGVDGTKVDPLEWLYANTN